MKLEKRNITEITLLLEKEDVEQLVDKDGLSIELDLDDPQILNQIKINLCHKE